MFICFKIVLRKKKNGRLKEVLLVATRQALKKFRKMEIGTTTQTNWQGTSRLNLACHVAKVDIFTSPCV